MVKLRRELFKNAEKNVISIENREKIELLHQQGKTPKEIAKLVRNAICYQDWHSCKLA